MAIDVPTRARFHPTLEAWFSERLGPPTAAQARAWPAIQRGEHVLLAAPTGSGKTLAAFLSSLNDLVVEADASGQPLPQETRVLYVSPLRALGNDIQKNLLGPLADLQARDPNFPTVEVLVRSGDTPARDRARMARRPPQVLVTTPESLYILLTSQGGRGVLQTVRTVIVDEIHAVIGSKRGAHLALSLERLEALCTAPSSGSAGRAPQRIGLSATQKPLSAVADFLVGRDRACTLIDEGHARPMDLTVRIPASPLEPVISHEVWGELHVAIAELVRQHRSTLVFVNTRKVAERTARELSEILGPDRVTSHHSSLSVERRLDAENRLKAGELDVLVATASLELGIDIGDVDLVIQVGTTRTIATLLQRIGRSGHGVGRTPKGVLFPVSPNELTEAAALMLAISRQELDVTPQPTSPLDILAQQVIAACVNEEWKVDDLLALIRRCWPYRDLSRERLDDILELHAGERHSLLHVDETSDTVRGTRRARIIAVTSGGAIPDKADYRVLAEPGSVFVGTVDEDFAMEASSGDVFQLGNMAWRVVRAESGVLRVTDAEGAPPSLPFWLGEAPARSQELSRAMGHVREAGHDVDWIREQCGLQAPLDEVLAEQLRQAKKALGKLPTQERLVIERFPDDSGGTQLVIHSLFGGRINRAFGLALRKKFCRSFGFELQAAANEESILISLGPMHSFPLDEVFDYLSPETVEATLRQAVLDSPMFTARWRWNTSRSLLAPRAPGGKRLPAPVLRMRADDLLAAAFPDAVACGENLPPGDLSIPEGHPILDQTLDDCLHEAMDIDGLVAVLEGLRDGRIERHSLDTAEPSPLALGALAIGPYGYLDDAGLEERRARAVRRGGLEVDEIGVLDPEEIERVRREAWPDPRTAEEVHEALLWMGYVTDAELQDWRPWIDELLVSGRVVRREDRYFAASASQDPLDAARGRLEVAGPIPIPHADSIQQALEAEGLAMRLFIDGVEHWCHRRLLARIQRRSREGRRRRVRPVSTAAFRTFLARWHGIAPGHRFEGPAGVVTAVSKLAGWEAAAPLWESALLRARVENYQPEWLDQAGLSGQVAWGRLWGSATPAVRATPISLFPRAELGIWESLAGPASTDEMEWRAERVLNELKRRGAMFRSDLERIPGLVPKDAEEGLDELIARGLATSDSFSSLRPLLIAPSKRRSRPLFETGRWSLFRAEHEGQPDVAADPEEVARLLLRRYGVLFRAVCQRERIGVFWRDLHRALRLMELRGDVQGGRFVEGYSGEQFALPAVPMLLKAAAEATGSEPGPGAESALSAADPLAAGTFHGEPNFGDPEPAAP
ncbi:ATP-dependent RNA helicase DbpA [Planctomycetes bacterium Poly30]|uniref:ATP-dependent RNA helicase DbpA n=1 Tax=Saltatorellus ferox TaxID=2528018 RepID=A0A518ESM3_9BACT|nr:ATP-dependent RNA helicase DbpA [Planctomycetes bacterium Poly30]